MEQGTDVGWGEAPPSTCLDVQPQGGAAPQPTAGGTSQGGAAPRPTIRRPRSLAFICGCFLFAIATGCGGRGKNHSQRQETSIAEQIAAAKSEADPGARAGALIRIGQEQTRAKDQAGASQSFSLAAEATEQISDPQMRASTFTMLANAQIKGDERLAAGRSLAQAEAAAAKIEEPTFRAAAQVALADLQAVLKSKAVALATLQAAARETLSSAARTSGRPTDPEFDVDLALSNDVAMLFHIAVAFQRLGGQDDAQRTMDAALGIIDKMKDDRDRSFALADAGEALASLGREDQSRATFDRALAAARNVGAELSKAYALKEIAGKLSDAGQLARAREILTEAQAAAERVHEPDLRRQALEEIERQRSAMQQR